MTLDETIKEFTDWAKDNRKEQNYWAAERNESYDETNPLSYADCEGFKRDAEERAEYHEQLAEWLTELKDLREENKVLTSECDRLIKEKGELLNKVSGGDVLRICQLEGQLQAELDNSHCLEIELAEAKRLLKAAVEDFVRIDEVKLLPENTIRPMLEYTNIIDIIRHKWRYADEALKLIGDESNGI